MSSFSKINGSDASVKIEVAGKQYDVPTGTTVAEVLETAGALTPDVIIATLNNHGVALDWFLRADGVIVPVSAHSHLGASAIRRTVSLMLHSILTERYPELSFAVGQSLLGGYFYEVRENGDAGCDLTAMAEELTAALAELADAELPFERRSIPVEAAAAVLTDPLGNKARLLTTRASSHISTVSLRDFVDIQHGPLAASTRHGKGARVVAYPPGLVLQFPGTEVVASPDKDRQLWNTYAETRTWNRNIGVETVGDLNRAVLEDRFFRVVRIAEGQQEKKIAHIADQIAARKDQARIVCVAGPSSSGKTTFVKRLSIQLQVAGLEPVVIGLDDYYRQRSECPRDEDGKLDFEALEALNLDLIHEQLAGLLRGDEVRVPKFDFPNQRPKPEKDWTPLQLHDNQILLIEGIHGLNPRLTETVPREATFRIYINALTQLVIDEHNRIFTSDTRLIRRIIRDRRYRGTTAAETIARWPSVRRGEERHIFPFEEEANEVFNSALVYEAAVLKTFAWRYLLEVPRDHRSRVSAYRLLNFLELFVPVLPEDVPATSVLREFLGGSGFSY